MSLFFFFSFLSILSLLVGAELLSILDETENGFIWEHIQSYAEQAHGAWLGISVKGRETLTHSLSLSISLYLLSLQQTLLKNMQDTNMKPSFFFFNSELLLPVFIIINWKSH